MPFLSSSDNLHSDAYHFQKDVYIFQIEQKNMLVSGLGVQYPLKKLISDKLILTKSARFQIILYNNIYFLHKLLYKYLGK